MSITRRASVAILLMVVCSDLRLTAQQPAASLEKLRIVRYSGDMAAFLSQITRNMGLTLGFEVDPKQPPTQLMLSVDDGTIADIMDAVVKAKPGYEWHRTGAGIDVYQVGHPNQLMDITVNNFQVSEVESAEAIAQLMNVPEVKGALLSLNMEYRQSRRKSPETPVKFSLNLHDVTVRQALHSIAKSSESEFWIMRKIPGPTTYFYLSTSPDLP